MSRFQALIVLAVLSITSAAAAAPTRIAVLYFDNDTGDEQFDPLQKGFADMLITDLAATKSLTVVERDRLQDVLDELQLQRSRYFDKKTALKIGKGLGAEYALTGSFVAIKPRVRINTRLIEIATGKVVFGTKVVGAPDQVFELEQELVANLLKGLERESTPGTSGVRSKIDIETVLEFSKGIELADRGDLEKAGKQLDRVISLAPTFTLARIRRKALVESYKASQERRQKGKEAAYAELVKRTERYLSSHKLKEMDQAGAEKFISYRVVRGQLLLNEMRNFLTPTTRSPKLFQRKPKQRARGLALADEYYRNCIQLLKELAFFYERFTKTAHGYTQKPSLSRSFDESDEKLMAIVGLVAKRSDEHVDVLLELAEFVLIGRARPKIGNHDFRYAPPLAAVHTRRGKDILRMVRAALEREDQAYRKTGKLPRDAIRYRELLADYHHFLGNREKEVRELQQIIDRYPGYARASYVEQRIEGALGMRHQHDYYIRDEWAKGLAKCQDNLLNKARSSAMADAEYRHGFAGVEALVKLVEKKCVGPGKKKLSFSLYQLYRDAGMRAAGHGWCQDFERYIRESVGAGLPLSEAKQWRKNVGCD